MKWMGLFLGSLLAVLIESSLWPVPALLIFVYFQLGNIESKLLVWWWLVLGVALDALVMRPMGSSSLGIMILLFGWWLITRFLEGWRSVEILWLLVATIVWQKVFWGQINWWWLPMVVVIGWWGKRRGRLSPVEGIRLR